MLPLFRLLGYPEDHRRGKYPVKIHQGRKGRNHEIDHIYFDSAEKDQQIIGKALVIVEAKRVNDNGIDIAIAQAQSYAERLRPLLIVVTNGHRLRVFRRHYRALDEDIIDYTASELATPEGIQQITSLLNFDAVLDQHRLLHELPHKQFISVEQALRAYPDIQELLRQGDFAEAEERNQLQLRVARPKVQIEGTLPVCMGGGSCEITFSHLLRRGLRIQLNHNDILAQLMVGIGSDPSWDTRRFIERETEETYLVHLGNLETRLSIQEAHDLCTCVDSFAGAYRGTIMQAEDVLESWLCPLSLYEGDLAFYLTSIHPSFWKQVRKFADDHDRRGQIKNHGWDRFEFWVPGFRIGHESGDHAWIATSSDPRCNPPIGLELKHLVYVIPNGKPIPDMRVAATEWQDNIGSKGQWSVRYTYEWLTDKLMPEVEQRCRANSEQLSEHLYFGQTHCTPSIKTYPHHDKIESSAQLVPYIADIQRWLTRYSARMVQTQDILKPYNHLFGLARNADYAQINLETISKWGQHDPTRFPVYSPCRACLPPRSAWHGTLASRVLLRGAVCPLLTPQLSTNSASVSIASAH